MNAATLIWGVLGDTEPVGKHVYLRSLIQPRLSLPPEQIKDECLNFNTKRYASFYYLL